MENTSTTMRFMVDAGTLAGVLKNCAMAVSRDYMRKSLEYICLESSGETMTAAATDSYRLHGFRGIAVDGDAGKLVLHSSSVKDALAVLQKHRGHWVPVVWEHGKDTATIAGQTVTVERDGDYVDWRRVVPHGKVRQIFIFKSAKRLAAQLKTILPLAKERSNKIALVPHVSGESIYLYVETAGNALYLPLENSCCECLHMGPPEFSVVLNCQYLIDSLQVFGDGRVSIQAEGHRSPLLLVESFHHDNIFSVVSPMQIEDGDEILPIPGIPGMAVAGPVESSVDVPEVAPAPAAPVAVVEPVEVEAAPAAPEPIDALSTYEPAAPVEPVAAPAVVVGPVPEAQNPELSTEKPVAEMSHVELAAWARAYVERLQGEHPRVAGKLQRSLEWQLCQLGTVAGDVWRNRAELAFNAKVRA